MLYLNILLLFTSDLIIVYTEGVTNLTFFYCPFLPTYNKCLGKFYNP